VGGGVAVAKCGATVAVGEGEGEGDAERWRSWFLDNRQQEAGGKKRACKMEHRPHAPNCRGRGGRNRVIGKSRCCVARRNRQTCPECPGI